MTCPNPNPALPLSVSGCAARGVEVSVALPGGEGALGDGQHPGAQGLDRRRLPDATRAQQASQIGGKSYTSYVRWDTPKMGFRLTQKLTRLPTFFWFSDPALRYLLA